MLTEASLMMMLVKVSLQGIMRAKNEKDSLGIGAEVKLFRIWGMYFDLRLFRAFMFIDVRMPG
jgi:hypothetical protein